MYRKNPEAKRSQHDTSHARGFADGGFAGGIFSEHPFATEGGRSPESYLNDDLVSDEADEVFDQIEEGVRPEHLLRQDDQEALALGRSVLGVAKAVGGLLRAVTSAGRQAAGDVRQRGMREALAQGLRRAADQFDQPTARNPYERASADRYRDFDRAVDVVEEAWTGRPGYGHGLTENLARGMDRPRPPWSPVGDNFGPNPWAADHSYTAGHRQRTQDPWFARGAPQPSAALDEVDDAVDEDIAREQAEEQEAEAEQEAQANFLEEEELNGAADDLDSTI